MSFEWDPGIIGMLCIAACFIALVAAGLMLAFGWGVGAVGAGVGVGVWLAAGYCWLQGVE